MTNHIQTIILIVALIAIVAFIIIRQSNRFDLPKGETVTLAELEAMDNSSEDSQNDKDPASGDTSLQNSSSSFDTNREIFVTDGEKHSIPLGEILSGGPPKDGIPSIDDPLFIGTQEADEWLEDTSVGLGVSLGGESRFYPYQILVWHEIVNDTIGGTPALVTYCPLCATGVVYDPTVNGTVYEFGVSGLLWQSNLLMYHRTGDEDTESLWSQVLGEAVVGPNTGTKLSIIRSDTVTYAEWKRAHPDTVVLSRDTGALRSYGRDPYGDYYTDNSAVGFGATFSDRRLEAKDFVLGVEYEGQYKAYLTEALPEGTTTDTFAGKTVTITRSENGEITMSIEDDELPYIGGFWFSWVAVHPETSVFK